MSLPEFSVRRPVTVAMATFAVMLFGVISVQQIPVELLPDLAYPTLTVQTDYPDAAPTSVEQFVTRPIEEAVGVTPGVREMRSVSRPGRSEVILEFDWDEPMDVKAMEVREKLGLAELPREADRPRVLRFDPSLDPIVRLAFTGDRPLDELRTVAERWIKPRLEAVKGIAAAKVRGGLDPEIQVEADEDRLAALGLTLDDLAQALQAENVNQAGGTLRDWGAVYLVRTLHEFEDLDQLRRTILRDGPGGRVRVEDVAQVTRGHRDRVEIMRNAGREAVEIALHREGSANTTAVAADVRLRLEEIEDELSDGLALTILTDQSRYIGGAIERVGWSALWGGLLAVLVLYFFLRDPLATTIIALTIPISLIATFLAMFRVGVTLNIMSLGGLALGIGMLVDNSIVVLEAIDRHRRSGRSRPQAAASGGREVAGAVTAATFTTVSVFVPIVFVQGIAGQLFYDLAVTVCLSLLASLVLSLTLIPMLSAIELRPVEAVPIRTVLGFGLGVLSAEPRPFTLRWGRMTLEPLGNGRSIISRTNTVLAFVPRLLWRLILLAVLFPLLWIVAQVFRLAIAIVGLAWWLTAWTFETLTLPLSKLLEGLGRVYPSGLSAAIRARWAILPVAFGLFALSVMAVPGLGTNLVPDLSQGEFAFRLHLKEGSTLATSAEVVERVEEGLLGDPRFARVFSVIGSLPSTASGRSTLGENLAQLDFVLHEGATAATEAQAIARVREVLALYPEVEAELVHPSVMTMRAPVAVRVFSEQLDDLDGGSAAVVQALHKVAGIEDVTTTAEPGHPEITIDIDRERAAALGIEAEALSRSLRRQIRGDLVGQFREQGERLDIRLRASQESRNRATDVGALRFRLPGGGIVPLEAVADVHIARGPAAIHRSGGGRMAEITAEVAGTDLGRTLKDVRASLATLTLPGGAVAELSGQDRELKVSFDSLRLALALAVFLVYVIMAIQFESLRYPFVILLSVPLGLVGVVAALMVTGVSISVLALIGAVMLAGIVVNNAIVLVDAINRRREEGQPLDQAILDAGRERLRPILMTTATTVLALLPMALGLGEGAELRRPMAITVIGGLSVATVLTLIVIPCLYRLMTPQVRDRVPAPRVGGEAVEEATP